MTKQEFLDGLRRALSGKVDIETIDETIRYYEEYIDVQVKTGKSEQEVLDQLGKPQLIAKSIVSANKNNQESGYPDSSDKIYEDGENQRYSRSKMGDKGVRFIMNMPGWMVAFLALFILFVFIWFVASVLSFLAPVLIPVAVILVIITFVKNRSR